MNWQRLGRRLAINIVAAGVGSVLLYLPLWYIVGANLANPFGSIVMSAFGFGIGYGSGPLARHYIPSLEAWMQGR